jgi:hypothetical protein
MSLELNLNNQETFLHSIRRSLHLNAYLVFILWYSIFILIFIHHFINPLWVLTHQMQSSSYICTIDLHKHSYKKEP